MMWGVKAPLSGPSLGWCTVYSGNDGLGPACEKYLVQCTVYSGTRLANDGVQLVKSIWCNNCPTFDCYCNAGKDSCPGGRDCIKKRGFNRKLYQTESKDRG